MKKIFALALVAAIAVTFIGCNMQIVDTTWAFDKAIVTLSNGEKIAEGKVDSWKDFENSDMVQVKIDGKTYLTHSTNVVMMAG